jgi:hypothetical protein
MYPKGHSSCARVRDDSNEWWLDEEGQEKLGVTPADEYLAKRSIQAHIYSRDEMDAFAEERKKRMRGVSKKALLGNYPSCHCS